MKPRRWLILATILALLGVAGPVWAQTSPPVTFSDPSASSTVWPNPIEATILNNTTNTLVVTLQFTTFVDAATGAERPAAELLQLYPPSITIAPAGQASLELPVRETAMVGPGSYTGSLVLSLETHNAVLRKPVTIIVPEPSSRIAAPPAFGPAVDSWTLNAVRVLPFLDPVCVRGLAFGCTIPIDNADAAPDQSVLVGHLTNERGGGLVVTLEGASERRGGALDLAFDRRWGLAGTYSGQMNFTPEDAASGSVDLTVNVKDVILWPLLCLWLGVSAARQVQRYLTIHRESLRLLERLNSVSLQFARLRKSVHGYTVAEDFEVRRDQLDGAIRDWDRTHYGEPTETEREAFATTVLDPLGDLEDQTAIWSQFRDKLDRLGRALLQDARPAIDQAEPPNGVDVREPRFFTNGRALLRGTKLQMPQVPDYGERIDKAAELASSWGELYELAILVRDAIRELSRSGVDLSESEREMLETARHHLNSAARDLWETPNLDDLRRRDTENELTSAQETTRRLMDPFVYYAGSELTAQLQALTPTAKDGGTEMGEALGSFPMEVLGKLPPMVRAYARIEAFRLPRLNFEAYSALRPGAERLAFVKRALLLGERTVTGAALITSVIAGLDRYFSTNFGSLSDYLALLTWGLAAKAGLELANAALSHLLSLRD